MSSKNNLFKNVRK